MVAGNYKIYLRALRRGTSSLIMLLARWIWKIRNAVVFDAALPDTASLSDTIRAEARSSASVGAIAKLFAFSINASKRKVFYVFAKKNHVTKFQNAETTLK
jgi:hypothetical protein